MDHGNLEGGGKTGILHLKHVTSKDFLLFFTSTFEAFCVARLRSPARFSGSLALSLSIYKSSLNFVMLLFMLFFFAVEMQKHVNLCFFFRCYTRGFFGGNFRNKTKRNRFFLPISVVGYLEIN